MATWKIVPTTRRTSRTDRVDILDDKGRYVAGYVARADALRMIHDPMQIAEDAINLFLELREKYDDTDAAMAAVLLEIQDAVTTDLDALRDEIAAEPAPATPDDLPF